MPWIKNRPLRLIVRYQLLFTVIVAISFGLLVGVHGAISAVLGGMVTVISSAAFAIIVSRHRDITAGGTLRTALRAESVKIVIVVLSLWLILTIYEEANLLILVGTFAVAVLINSMALLISEDAKII